MGRKYKPLVLLFAGAFLSVLGGLIVEFKLLNIEIIFGVLASLAFILFLWGSGIISLVRHSFNLWKRKGNVLFRPKVGILNDMGSDIRNETFVSTDITPEKWKEGIAKQAKENRLKIKIKFTDVSKNFDSYTALLNPYGSVYPEDDLKNFKTMNKILDYVKEGGLFVNVADIPCYWAYDKFSEIKLNTTPPIYALKSENSGKISIEPIRTFELTPILQKLGLRVFNVEKDNMPIIWDVKFEDIINKIIGRIDKIKVNRVVEVERNVVPLIKPKEINYTMSTPFFIVKYSYGEFLISLLFLDNIKIPENNNIREVLAKTVIKLIKKRREIQK